MTTIDSLDEAEARSAFFKALVASDMDYSRVSAERIDRGEQSPVFRVTVTEEER